VRVADPSGRARDACCVAGAHRATGYSGTSITSRGRSFRATAVSRGEDHGTLEVFDLRTGKHLPSVSGFETPTVSFPFADARPVITTAARASSFSMKERSPRSAPSNCTRAPIQSVSTAARVICTSSRAQGREAEESWLEEIDPVTTHKIGEVHLDAAHVEAMASSSTDRMCTQRPTRTIWRD